MFAKHYARFYDQFNYKKPYKKEIDFVYKWADLPKRIFDIGAGTGSYWKYYPEDVFILGIDKSVDMAKLAPPGRHIIPGDMETFKSSSEFDCATAIFDVMNYFPNHSWWKNIPLKKDGYFIFDVWDKEKIEKDGFSETLIRIGDLSRKITPGKYDGTSVELMINFRDRDVEYYESHWMYIYSFEEIEQFCGNEFQILEVRPTKRWQTWYRLRKK